MIILWVYCIRNDEQVSVPLSSMQASNQTLHTTIVCASRLTATPTHYTMQAVIPLTPDPDAVHHSLLHPIMPYYSHRSVLIHKNVHVLTRHWYAVSQQRLTDQLSHHSVQIWIKQLLLTRMFCDLRHIQGHVFAPETLHKIILDSWSMKFYGVFNVLDVFIDFRWIWVRILSKPGISRHYGFLRYWLF